jgi:hypothetical protein
MKKLLALSLTSLMALATLTSCSSGAGSASGYKTGLGIVTHIDSSASKTDEAGPKGQVDTYIAAITIDGSGKITKCSLDTAQTVVNFDAEGVLASDVAAPVFTKTEKKDDYGMRNASGIGKEWFEQADAFSKWCVGKTLDQVKGLKLKEVEGHNVPDVPELSASVTMDVATFIQAVEKAFANAV